jgi:CheY-like chemotaxis protein
MRKILVVEDDERTAVALGARIKAMGYRPLLAFEALTGVAMATRHEPDLIILDIAMPLGGGFSVAERLQNMPTTALIPIIFVTASQQPGLLENAMALGAAGFLEKPYDADELLAMIRDVLGRSADAQAVEH